MNEVIVGRGGRGEGGNYRGGRGGAFVTSPRKFEREKCDVEHFTSRHWQRSLLVEESFGVSNGSGLLRVPISSRRSPLHLRKQRAFYQQKLSSP